MESSKYIKTMVALDTRQMILQGPPGTSKTYQAKETVARELVKEHDTDGKYNACSLSKDDIEKALEDFSEYWKMVQFHPSYGYEDFVRGIAVETENDHVIYKTVNKVFGEICEKAKEDTKHNYFLIIDELNRADVATVFGELLYALEYRGEKISIPYKLDENKKKPDNGETKLSVPNKLHVTATMDTREISASYTLDNGGGKSEGSEDQQKNGGKQLDGGRGTLTVPENLYVIATMNTADKSVGNLDYAIRRRFVFFDCPPDRKIIRDYLQKHWKGCAADNCDDEKCEVENCPHKNILALFDGVNNFVDDHISENFRKIDFRIGHTYFMPKKPEDENGKPWTEAEKEVNLKFQYQVLPILREYNSDGLFKSLQGVSDILTNYLKGQVEITEKPNSIEHNEVTLKDLKKAFLPDKK